MRDWRMFIVYSFVSICCSRGNGIIVLGLWGSSGVRFGGAGGTGYRTYRTSMGYSPRIESTPV